MNNLFHSSFLVACFTLVLNVQANSQSLIEGSIKDVLTGEALVGAVISLEDSYIGTYSNQEGDFRLQLKSAQGKVLIVSYLGYQSQRHSLQDTMTLLDIRLKEVVLGSNEVVVTAQIERQLVQEIPMTVNVLDADFIERTAEMNDPGDLIPYVPGFSGKNYSSAGSWYTIRGINTNSFGIGAESKVAIFHDHAYNGRPTTAGRGYFDVNRVELIKGPQGTLFGRNATAGVINIISNQPRFRKEFSINSYVGNWGQIGANYILNLPLSSKIAVRYAGQVRNRDGVLQATNQDNHQVGKEDIVANRLSVLWRPSGAVNMLLKLEQQKNRGGGFPIKSTTPTFGRIGDFYSRSIELDTKPFDDNQYQTLTWRLNWVLNEHMALNVISSWNRNEQQFLADLDGSPAKMMHFNNPNEFSNSLQEIQLSSRRKRLDWFIGASFFQERAKMDIELLTSDFFTLPLLTGFPQDFCSDNPICRLDAAERSQHIATIESTSLYSNISFTIIGKLRATAGLRYNIDHKQFDTQMSLGAGGFYELLGFNLQGNIGKGEGQRYWSGWQPRFGLQYRFRENLMTYANYSRGFLAGGFNNYTASSFETEVNDAYEIGFKSTAFDEKLRLNLAGYFIDYRNLQVEFVQPGITQVNNAGKLESKGLELESILELAKGLKISLNIGLNKARYLQYFVPHPSNPNAQLDFSGKHPNRSPRTQITSIVYYQKRIEGLGRLFIRTDLSYQSREYFSRDNTLDRSMGGYSLFNLSFGLSELWNDKVSISFYVNNLFDQDFMVYNDTIFQINNTMTPGLPRILGLKLGLSNLLN